MKIATNFLWIGVIFMMLSCQKDPLQKPSIPQNPILQSVDYEFEDFSRSNLMDRFFNPEDLADENINESMARVARGLASFSDDQSLLNIIYSEVSNSENDEVKYTRLIALNSDFKSKMNTFLKPFCFADKPLDFDCIVEIDAGMIYDGVDYYPNIYIPNIRVADLSKTPIICIAEAVTENDNILGFKLNNNGNITQTVVSEQQAMNASVPIIIITNGTDHIEDVNDLTAFESPPENLPVQRASSRNYQWQQYQIKEGFAYERGGKSEIYAMITWSDDFGGILENGLYSEGDHNKLIAKIHQDDIANSASWTGQSIEWSSSPDISDADIQSYPKNYVTIYERDWYNSKKAMSTCIPLNRYHAVRTRYSCNWYIQIECKNFDTDWLTFDGATYQRGGLKCLFTLERDD